MIIGLGVKPELREKVTSVVQQMNLVAFIKTKFICLVLSTQKVLHNSEFVQQASSDCPLVNQGYCYVHKCFINVLVLKRTYRYRPSEIFNSAAVKDVNNYSLPEIQ